MSRPSPWLLPEDGIVDDLAVEIAASGARRVALTQRERELAAARIIADGGDSDTIREQLGCSRAAALALARQIRSAA